MGRLIRSLAVFGFLCGFGASARSIDPRHQSVEVSAEPPASLTEIKLRWPGDPNAISYTLSRKVFPVPLPEATVPWSKIADLAGTAVGFTDPNTSAGWRYEYQVLKTNSSGFGSSGYLLSGINIHEVESRGKLILLVDSTFRDSLALELKRLEQDLSGDGWTVIRQDISRTAAVTSVKALIQSIYAQDPANVKSLFLFGHIPVPYSGDADPDGHPNHRGAWPADVYYADMDGLWTDSTVNDSAAEKNWNWNVPGDGKFDQSVLPSDVELEIGRVDLSNLTCFSNKTPSRDELALLRQYLDKNHAFRTGNLPVQRRGVVCDNFEADAEALTSTAWRSFAALFGAEQNTQIPSGTFFSTLDSHDYLWAFGDGGGGYYTCAGIGGSDDFALNDIKPVFTSFFGSYFGDWDNESSFLRAPLGSTSHTLVCIWGGRPYWFLHPMGLGETIGYCTRITQNNDSGGSYLPLNYGTRGVHTALMGDPTLRLHPVIPASNLTATPLATGVDLNWTASPDSNIQGYDIFRGVSESGPFTKISGTSDSLPRPGLQFTDPDGAPNSVYMVRSAKLESSGSGTYYNLSEGIFARPYSVPAAPGTLVAAASSGSVALAWQDLSSDETGFDIYRAAGVGSYVYIATVAANAQSFTDTSTTPGTTYSYRIDALNAAGQSGFSNEAVVTVTGGNSIATFVRMDQATGGSWQGAYGRDGYNIVDDSYNYPSFVDVTLIGQNDWIWNWVTSDPVALHRATDDTQLAACWYATSPFDIRLSFTDIQVHRVAIYCLDWDIAGREEVIDVVGADGVSILSTKTINHFENGVYLVWDLQGQVTLRVHPNKGNAVLSGLFFDPALEQVLAPVIDPPGGKFTNEVTVSIADTTPGAMIRYTLDGSNPTPASQVYSGPITFTNSTTLKTIAGKTGMSDSTIVTANYNVITPAGPTVAHVTFNGVNNTQGGTWKGLLGLEGYSLVADGESTPSYLTITPSGNSDWTWEYDTADLRALQRSDLDSRFASCWYASDSFDVDFDFKDNAPHRVSIYCVDWDFGGREQTIQIVDYATGQVMHEYDLKNFTSGAYLDYTVSGRIIMRFQKVAAYNSVLSGIFLDNP